MFKSLLRGAAPFLLLFASASLAAQPVPPITTADLLRHIQPLAGDAFQGRAPGTEGERLTINYIAEQLRARGLEPAGENGSWFQPVRLVERTAGTNRVRWTVNGNDVPFEAGEILLQGKDSSETVADAPVVFAGHGVRMPDRGIDQLAGADLRGAIVLILAQGPQIEGFPSVNERVRTVADAGAAAVLVIVSEQLPWQVMANQIRRPSTRLASQWVPELTGMVRAPVVQRIVAAAGGDFGRMLNEQPGSSFRSIILPVRGSMEVATSVQPYTSNNVVGRLRGSAAAGETLLLLAHWDHFGLCRPEGAPDRICNGAVDNASGIATMIEVAGRLAAGPRPTRDILFLATTSEEVGLLGAEYFVAHPTVPLASIQVAVNMDTVAIHPAGAPVAVMGRGIPSLDAAIDATVAAMGRRLDNDDEAAELVQRQDGWKLTQAGVPAIMVGGSFSDMALLNGFLRGRYHAPDDQADGQLVLDGAAEDANLTVALARRLADPAYYRRPARGAEAAAR